MILELPALSTEQIASLVHGRCLGSSQNRVNDVQVDSRSCNSGSLFVALEGERTDGHLFLEDAFRRGSSLSFVSRLFFKTNQAKVELLCSSYDVTVIVVESTRRALQGLATRFLDDLDGLTVIGITGSNGKTTTKDLLGGMISPWVETFVTPGNYNSDIGLPLASLRLGPEHKYAVIEMGSNRPGEIAELTSIARPKLAAITGIGTAHIGLFGSQRGIATEKRAIFANICPDGHGFIPENEPFAEYLSEGVSACVETFGLKSTEGYGGTTDLGLRGFEMNLDGALLQCELRGKHNVQNALCAVSIAKYVGVPAEYIHEGIRSATPGFGRGEVFSGRRTVFFDGYNANRESMLRAIETVESISWTGRKILILGSMKELGSASEEEHRAVARAAAPVADVIYFLGEEAEVAHREAEALRTSDTYWFESFPELADAVSDGVKDGDLVLLKGSRKAELERLVPYIDAELAAGAHLC